MSILNAEDLQDLPPYLENTKKSDSRFKTNWQHLQIALKIWVNVKHVIKVSCDFIEN